MSNEPTVPVATDDFAEFAQPPRQRPRPGTADKPTHERPSDSEQGAVDAVLARLRRERAEGKR